MSTSEERGRLAEGATLVHQQQIELVNILKRKGFSNAAIAQIMRISENTVRILVSKSNPE